MSRQPHWTVERSRGGKPDTARAARFEASTHVPTRVLRCEQRRGAAHARWLACREVRDDEVIVFLDGDDFLLHRHVLASLAEVYASGRIKAAFGRSQYETVAEVLRQRAAAEHRPCRRTPQGEDSVFFPHLRSCVAAYAKAVPPSHLQDADGRWYMFCTDVALFTSVVELIGDRRAVFLDTDHAITYNIVNALSSAEGWFKISAARRSARRRHIRAHQPLPPLLSPPVMNRQLQGGEIDRSVALRTPAEREGEG